MNQLNPCDCEPLREVLGKMTKDRDQWREYAQKELDRANSLSKKLLASRERFMSIRTMSLTVPDKARTHLICIEACDGANALSDDKIYPPHESAAK